MTYNFTVTNSSGTVTAAQPIVLTDSLPDGLTYASDNSGSLADWFCVVEGQNITCTYDQDLGPGASAPVLTLVADTNASGVASGTSAEITNTATVTSPTTEANITNNTSSDNFLLTLPVSDLTIAKTDFDAAYVVTGQQNTGEQLVYTITIKNNGVVATTGPIEIRETLPAFNSGVTSYPVTYVSHSGLGPDGTTAITWVCTEGIDPTTTTACTTATTGETTFTYDGSLAPGETAQLRLVVLGPSVDPTTLDSTTTTNNVEIFNANDGSTQTKTAAETTPLISGGSRYNVAVRKRLTQVDGVTPTCTITPSATSYGTTETCTTTVAPGDPITYTVTLANNLNAGSNLVNVQISDYIPDALSLNLSNVSCTATGFQGQNNTVCDTTAADSGRTTAYNTSFSLFDATTDPPRYRVDQTAALSKNGGIVTYTFTGTLKDASQLTLDTNTVTNRVTAPLTDGTNADQIPTDNIAVTTFPIDATDLAITKTDATFPTDPGGTSFVAGTQGTYILRVANVDTRPTVGEVNVTDDIPDEFEVLYAQGTGWNCAVEDATDPATVTDPALDGVNNNIVTCSTANTLNGGDTRDITIAVRPIAAWISPPETFTNLARVSTPGDNNPNNNGYAPGTDTSAVDETAGALFGYEDTQVVAENVDLAITKASSSTFSVGQTAAYNLTIANRGPTVATASAADPIIVTDILPAGLSFQSATGAGWSCTATEVTDNTSATRDKVRCLRETNMAVDTPSTLSINVFVDGDVATSITNTAYVDVAPADFTGVNTGLGSDSATHPAETAGYSTNEASTSRNIHSLNSTVTLSSDLSITKVATSQTKQTNPPQFVDGSVGTYTITVTNNGPSDYAGIIRVDEDLVNDVNFNNLTGSLSFNSFSGTGWSCTDLGNSGACTNGDTNLQFTNSSGLTAGSSASFTLNTNVSVTAGASNSDGSPGVTTDDIDNTVTVSGDTANDAVATNNTATETVDAEADEAVLTITKDDDDGDRDQDADPSDDTRFVTGGEGSYFLIVTNNGPSAATNVQIAENSGFTATSLPSGLTYQGYALTQNWSCNGTIGGTTFTCTYGQWTDTDGDGLVGEPGDDTFVATDMPVNTTSGLELIVGIDSSTALGTLTNTVSANADNATEVTASEPTIIVEPADLEVTKTGVDTIDAITNAEGSDNPGTYTITVTNNGPGDAQGDLYLTDYLPDGLVYYSGAPQPTTGTALGDGTWTVLSYNEISNQIAFRRSATLSNGASSTIEVPVEVTANPPTIARNFVRVTSVTTPEPDYNTTTTVYDNPDNAPCDRDLDNYDGSGSLTTQPVDNCAVKETTITNGLETTILKIHQTNDTVEAVDITASGSGFSTVFPYTIEVTNANATDVGNVIVQETLPESMEYSSITSISEPDSDVAASVAGREFTRSCSYASDTRLLTCNLGTVDASEVVTIMLNVTPNISGIITNTVGYLSGGSNTDSESVNIINPPNANTISGTVFQDVGKDGGTYIDGTDISVQNITVNLYRDVNNDDAVDAGDVLLSATPSTFYTDANNPGYSFETSLTGEFVVAVDTADTDLPGTQTFTTATSYGVTLSGSDSVNNDFGYSIPAGDLLFVKRITAINSVNTNSSWIDDTDNTTGRAADDNNANWPSPQDTYLRGVLSADVQPSVTLPSGLQPGDEVEYTVYFLSSGGSPIRDVKFCDLIPQNTTYVAGSMILGYDASGNALPNPAGSPGDPGIVALNDGSADDGTNPDGRFYTSADTLPPDVSNVCTALGANNGGVNTDGAVYIPIVDASTDMPYATAPGIPIDSYGFVRFRVTVD